MEDHVIIVTVANEDGQREAFRFVEAALEAWLEQHEDLAPDGVRLETPDGTLTVEM